MSETPLIKRARVSMRNGMDINDQLFSASAFVTMTQEHNALVVNQS